MELNPEENNEAQGTQMTEQEFDEFKLKLSSGVAYLTEGYIDYSKEVIKSRALPNMYDGLKPVHRHIMWTLKCSKRQGFIKSAKIAGDTLTYHPHGDGAVYEALILMTDKNGSLTVPLLDGNGNFGGVYTTKKAAASRYTEAKLSDDSSMYFGEMNGIKMIPNFDSTETEPYELPVAFPSVLVNASSGIAVGFRSNIPSFNFNDVCNLVIEYIENGRCSTVIAPDFVTGGYYVKNNKELLKLMQTGSARLKLRGRTVIDGKNIIVTEVPFGKTIEGIIKQVYDKKVSGITKCINDDDNTRESCMTLVCSNKATINESLYSVLKETDLQYTFTADITTIQNEAPRRCGVWTIIEEWVKWRREVLTKEYTVRREACVASMREAKAFMAVVNNRPLCEQLTALLVKEGRNAGLKFVEDNWSREDVPADLISFVCHRRIADYHDGGKYRTLYDSKSNELYSIDTFLSNIDSLIVSQMKNLIATVGIKHPRRTEVTNTDYEFTETEKVEVKDTSTVFYSLKNNFLRKLHYSSNDKKVQCEFQGTASDTLIAIDNRGRILRLYCEDIPMNSATDWGTWIPSYCGLEETDDYKVLYLGKLDGRTLTVIYKDGNIGFVDEQEWMKSTRNVRVLENGIAQSDVGAILDYVPEMIFVTDGNGCLGCTYTDRLKRKDRRAKTRAFTLRKGALLDTYAAMPIVEGMQFITGVGNYEGKMTPIASLDDINGNIKVFKEF